MTPEQVALYGGAVWLGPVVLLSVWLLYLWLSGGPYTERGRRKARARLAEWEAEAPTRFPELYGGVPSPPREADLLAQGDSERLRRSSSGQVLRDGVEGRPLPSNNGSQPARPPDRGEGR